MAALLRKPYRLLRVWYFPRFRNGAQYPIDPGQILTIKSFLRFHVQYHGPYPEYFLFRGVVDIGKVVQAEVAFWLESHWEYYSFLRHGADVTVLGIRLHFQGFNIFFPSFSP